ncbi:MAG TPA: hypothetical protein ACFYD3_00250 [Candidatus Hypogeohydataceae bacterium YC41]
MRVLSLVIFLLCILEVSLAGAPEKAPPYGAPSAEKGGMEAPAEETSTGEQRKEQQRIEHQEREQEKEQQAKEEKKPEVPVTETQPEEKREKKKEKWTKAEGGDFAYRDVVLRQGGYTFVTQFEGDMVNNSGMDYSIVKFMCSIYDSRGRLLTEEAFHIIDFDNGQTKHFRGTLVDGFREISSFKIRFKSGVAAAR